MSVIKTVWDRDPGFFEDLRAAAPSVRILASGSGPHEEGFETDAWQCVWRHPGGYLLGQVVGHPIDDWSKLSDYELPSPATYLDWASVKADRAQQSDQEVRWGNVDHGFLYLKLVDLRGFENLMVDVAEERQELFDLRDMIVDYWLAVVERWLDVGVDAMLFGDDLGHQLRLPMNPSAWRRILKPGFERVFSLCRRNGVAVYLHTDGRIVDIVADLLEIGVSILNPQDLVNGIGNLRELAWGKSWIDLDIDRQSLTAFGQPREIDAHIRRCVETLGSPGGLLALKSAAYEGTPKENIAQVALSMEKYHDRWTTS